MIRGDCMDLEKAIELAMKTDYAVFAAEQEENPISEPDAGAFFLAGYNYAIKTNSGHAVLADVRAIIDSLYKKEIDDDIYSSKDLIKAKRIDEYNNALNDVKEKLSEHFS